MTTGPALLKPREAAAMLRVHPNTLWRYVSQGLLRPVRLPSGHRRYRAAEIQAILDGPADGAA